MALVTNQTVFMFATYNGYPISTAQSVPLSNMSYHNSTIESDTRYWGPSFENSTYPFPPPSPFPPAQPIPTSTNNPTSLNNALGLSLAGRLRLRTVEVSTPYGNFSVECDDTQLFYVSGSGPTEAQYISPGTAVATSVYNGSTSNFCAVVSNTINIYALINMYNVQYSSDVADHHKWIYVNNIVVR
jgi:hypothetical protein